MVCRLCAFFAKKELHRLGSGKKNLLLFLSCCTRLALPFDKVGCGSAMGKKNLLLFLSHCTRLALPLFPQKVFYNEKASFRYARGCG